MIKYIPGQLDEQYFQVDSGTIPDDDQTKEASFCQEEEETCRCQESWRIKNVSVPSTASANPPQVVERWTVDRPKDEIIIRSTKFVRLLLFDYLVFDCLQVDFRDCDLNIKFFERSRLDDIDIHNTEGK